MKIIERMKCSKCKEIYKGHFKMNLNGDIVCLDCENKQYYTSPHYVEVKTATLKREFLKDNYTKMLLLDVDTIYRIISKEDEDYTSQFYTTEGTINTDKLYYYDNLPDLVFDAHNKVQECLKRLEKKETKFKNHDKIIKIYLELREKKFTQKEVTEAREILYDSELEKGEVIE